VQVIAGDRKMILVINQDGCIKCGTCLEVCPFDAVIKVSGETIEVPSEPVPLGSFS
jgi:NAD-dependent dihydropyrimidine dehydrogenase PreA subunit